MSRIGIALLGCGTVGGGTAEILTKDINFLNNRTGLDLELKKIIDLNFDHAKSIGIPESLFETDYQKVLDDPSINIIIELVGGTTFAKTSVEKALNAKKHVITANKALLASYGKELFALARTNGVTIGFEASCAGGIPIIKAMTEGLIANKIDALYGIVNGTCNFILSEMDSKGKSYSDALADAQKDGLAEADPTLDVSGMDSAHKIAIMSALAFGQSVDLSKIPVEGIDELNILDLKIGKELGYTMKLIAVAQNTKQGISLRVRPTFITKEHPLSWIAGPFNAVSAYGHAVGHTMYYGRGAGASPTASAVVADLVGVANGTMNTIFSQFTFWPDLTPEAKQLPITEVSSRYYLRIMTADKPGALSSITGLLAKEGISISSALQKELPEGQESPTAVPLVITTHKAKEGNILKAIKNIDNLDVVEGPSLFISILDEHLEKIN